MFIFDPKINTGRFTPRRTRYSGKDDVEAKESSEKKK